GHRSASGNARPAWHRVEQCNRSQESGTLDRCLGIHCARVPEHFADIEQIRASAWLESESARRRDCYKPDPMGTVAGVGGRGLDVRGARNSESWRPKRIPVLAILETVSETLFTKPECRFRH